MKTQETVKDFKYLGSILTLGNEVTVEVLTSIARGARCRLAIKNVLNKRGISLKTRVRVDKKARVTANMRVDKKLE